MEHYVAHAHDRSIVGNIYLGKVHTVLPGMEAAFIDIGEERNAVLYAGEVVFDEEVDGEIPRIETVLKSGQPIMAQVTRDPMGSKGARLTTEISLPGRYLVLVPEAESLGISRRLPDVERKRLRDIATVLRPNGYGLIVRTAAHGAGETELRRDIDLLLDNWQGIYQKGRRVKPPQTIYSEPELIIRVVRDLFTREVGKMIVDDRSIHESVRSYIGETAPDLAELVEFYEDTLPLFERFHVSEQIRKALDRKVWLPSGGHIVIDRTEAMTVIDVNTGRYVGKSTLEETVLKNNVEAAKEIAKQLRLRDIGGIIVIDFIDMIKAENRSE
ncbi:MAG: Rne/Rng family ribonuclease, partial [Acidimicrobiia bacterium]